MDETETKYYTAEEWAALTEVERHEVEKQQLWRHLEEAGLPAAEGFLTRLNEGGVDGRWYWNDAEENPYGKECGCVLGTLAYYQRGAGDAGGETDTDDWDSSQFIVETYELGTVTVVEVLAYNIKAGETPENNQNARLLRDWTQEWIENQRIAS